MPLIDFIHELFGDWQNAAWCALDDRGVDGCGRDRETFERKAQEREQQIKRISEALGHLMLSQGDEERMCRAETFINEMSNV